ncbi:histidine kinase [Flavobacteriaceae bacterium UJ101]|nr:histidine kinase [Flavobacteriaceae bacterium UJ101]
MIKNSFIFFFLLYSFTYSQTLRKEAEVLLKQSKQTRSSNLDSSYFYLEKGLKKAHQLQNDTLLAKYYFNLGDIFYEQKKINRAKNNTIKALSFSNKSNFRRGVQICLQRLGFLEKETNNYTSALNFYQKALKLSEKYHFNKSIIFLNSFIADLHNLKNDSIKTLYHYNKALNYSFLLNDSINIIDNCNKMGEFFRNNQNQDSALYYYKKGIKYASSLHDHQQLSMLYLNMASLLLEEKSLDLNLAYNYLERANRLIQPSKENDRYFIYNGLLALYYNYKKQYKKSLFYYQKAEEYSSSKRVSDPTKSILYYKISQLFLDMKNYEKAYTYFSKHKELNDSLFQIDKEREFAQVRTEYEVEKKDQQIGLLTKEKELEASKRKQFIYGAVALVIPLLLLLLFYRNRVKTQKLLNEKEVQRLEKEKALEQAESLLKGQDQERNRLAKEIHDGVGAQLAGLKLNLEDLNHELNHPELGSVTHKLENTFAELRSISHNLSVNYIQEHTLKELLTEVKIQYEKKKIFNIEMTLFPSEVLDTLNSFQKHHLYRIIQELFHNTYKHAHATQVLLSFTLRDTFLYIIYEDNGKGFDVSLLQKGIGLHNIEERIHALNGNWEIDSHPKSGTTIVLTIPQNL